MLQLWLTFLLTITTIHNASADQTYEKATEKLEQRILEVERQTCSVSDLLLSIEEKELDILTKPSVVAPEKGLSFIKARAVCTGSAQGALCFDVRNLPRLKRDNGAVILVTDRIHNDDFSHIKEIAGIFAFKEDPSSHAVIVARVHNIPCLTFYKDDRQANTWCKSPCFNQPLR